jgi:2-(1,2-epoxy-1,2-dihydrophenyl)acetyl-CoA isomerase
VAIKVKNRAFFDNSRQEMKVQIMSTSDHLLVNVNDGVAVLTFNRPERLNALSGEMIVNAIATLEKWAVDPNVGCIVVTGAERGFCAGGDVTAMNAGEGAVLTFEQRLDRQRASHRLSGLLYSIPKVTIAAVNGAAAGAGLSIALACDLRIASDKAKFTTAFAKVGFGGDFGITWPLTRMLGEAKAKELLFLSDVLTAEQADALGLVNRVVPHEQLMTAARELATGIAKGPQVSYRYMKENVRLASQQDYNSMLDREAWTHLHCGETEDHREGARAFVEKRAPQFKGK